MPGGVEGTRKGGPEPPEHCRLLQGQPALVERQVRRRLHSWAGGVHWAVHQTGELLGGHGALGQQDLVDLAGKVCSYCERPRFGIGKPKPGVGKRSLAPQQPPHVQLEAQAVVDAGHVDPPIVRPEVLLHCKGGEPV